MTQQNTTLDDLAALVGFSATIKVAAWYGGLNVFVPRFVKPDQVLVRLLGESAAKRLCDEWGGCFLAVPPLNAYENEVQRRQIGRMLEQQFGCKEIARHNRLSERRVQQIARELEVSGLIRIVVPRKRGPKAGQKLGQQFLGKNDAEEMGGGFSSENAPEKTPLKNEAAFSVVAAVDPSMISRPVKRTSTSTRSIRR